MNTPEPTFNDEQLVEVGRRVYMGAMTKIAKQLNGDEPFDAPAVAACAAAADAALLQNESEDEESTF